LPSALLLLTSFLLCVSASDDIGGGSGRVKSPYAPGKPVLVAEIARIKNISTRTRVLRDVPNEGTHVTGGGKDVGLAFVKGENVIGKPSFVFKGTTEDGAKTLIDFSEVHSFSVVQREDVRVLIEVEQFPIITPEELISRSPTYTDLFDHNRKTLRLWVATKSAGKDLSLVGKDENKRYRVIAKLNQISLNTKVDLDYGTFVFGDLNLPAIWWATESVTRDDKYPYRIFVRARAPGVL
jgi:hypothetical protein